MSNQDKPEYKFLRQEVENKWGRRLSTSADFAAIAESMDESVSSSTLKRFWGYVAGGASPRNSTLDSLSRYAGYRNYKAFRDSLVSLGKLPSGFFSLEKIDAAALHKGDSFELGWRPNRRIVIYYEGGGLFRVVSSENSLLRPGDKFEASLILKGYPMALSGIIRPDGKTDPYVAGLDGGIAFISKV